MRSTRKCLVSVVAIAVAVMFTCPVYGQYDVLQLGVPDVDKPVPGELGHKGLSKPVQTDAMFRALPLGPAARITVQQLKQIRLERQ